MLDMMFAREPRLDTGLHTASARFVADVLACIHPPPTIHQHQHHRTVSLLDTLPSLSQTFQSCSISLHTVDYCPSAMTSSDPRRSTINRGLLHRFFQTPRSRGLRRNCMSTSVVHPEQRLVHQYIHSMAVRSDTMVVPHCRKVFQPLGSPPLAPCAGSALYTLWIDRCQTIDNFGVADTWIAISIRGITMSLLPQS